MTVKRSLPQIYVLLQAAHMDYAFVQCVYSFLIASNTEKLSVVQQFATAKDAFGNNTRTKYIKHALITAFFCPNTGGLCSQRIQLLSPF